MWWHALRSRNEFLLCHNGHKSTVTDVIPTLTQEVDHLTCALTKETQEVYRASVGCSISLEVFPHEYHWLRMNHLIIDSCVCAACVCWQLPLCVCDCVCICLARINNSGKCQSVKNGRHLSSLFCYWFNLHSFATSPPKNNASSQNTSEDNPIHAGLVCMSLWNKYK